MPDAWLADYDSTDASRTLDRLAADQDLITTLGLQGYQGRDYTVFETELAKYGIAVIGGWIRRSLIFTKCKQPRGPRRCCPATPRSGGSRTRP